ncbi:chemotaxis protein CheY [Geomonas sp. Red276]
MALQDIRVLIVDDEIFFRHVLRDMLGKIGFTVAGDACDGDDAVEKFRTLRPHVVLMDIYMINMSGIEATKKMLASDPNAKVVICSASDADYDAQAALDAGAKLILKKPFVPREVYEAIRKALTGK